jgi:hypothetical protein
MSAASREDRHQAEEAAQPTEDKGTSSLLHRLRCWAEPALWSVLVTLAGILLAAGLGVRP